MDTKNDLIQCTWRPFWNCRPKATVASGVCGITTTTERTTGAIKRPRNARKRYKKARFLIGKIFTIIPQTTMAIRLISLDTARHQDYFIAHRP